MARNGVCFLRRKALEAREGWPLAAGGGSRRICVRRQAGKREGELPEWAEMHAEIGVDERAMLELQAKTTDAYFNSLVVTYLEISDDSFRAAFQRFVDAEGKFKSAYAEGEVMDKIKQMRLALDELSKASEHYIFLS
jgi:hypothetical protein